MQGPDGRMEPSESREDANPKDGFKLQRSVYKGVYKCGNKFKAQIQINRVQHYLGLFDDEVQAAVAYDNHARIILGSRARTNFDEFGHASPTFPVAPTEPIKQEKLKQEHHAVESRVRGHPKSRKRLYIGINQRPRRFSEDGFQQAPSNDSPGSVGFTAAMSMSTLELQADMQDSAALLGQLRAHTGSSDRSDEDVEVEPYVASADSEDAFAGQTHQHPNQHSLRQQLHRPDSVIAPSFPRSTLLPRFNSAPALIPGAGKQLQSHQHGQGQGDLGYFPPPAPSSTSRSGSGSNGYFSMPFVPPHLSAPFPSLMAGGSGLLSAENLHQLNLNGEVAKVKSLSAKTSLESMRSCTPPPTAGSTSSATTSAGLCLPSAHLAGQVSHWAGVLQTDTHSQVQVWRGTWVPAVSSSCFDGGRIPEGAATATAKPPPSAFARSPNHFEYTSEIEFAVDSAGHQGAPRAGFLKGCFSRTDEGPCGKRPEPGKSHATYEDREMFLEFAPSGVAHRYTATGSGDGDCGAFVVHGQFSAISSVLELTRQYISE